MREVTDAFGVAWTAAVTSHGTSSAYLNRKVHRPVVQFTCVACALPRRYAPLPLGVDSLEQLDDAGLLLLLEGAKVH